MKAKINRISISLILLSNISRAMGSFLLPVYAEEIGYTNAAEISGGNAEISGGDAERGFEDMPVYEDTDIPIEPGAENQEEYIPESEEYTETDPGLQEDDEDIVMEQQTLYKSTGSCDVTATGIMPEDSELIVYDADISKEHEAGIKELIGENADIISALDITISSEAVEDYQPVDSNEVLEIKVSSDDFEGYSDIRTFHIQHDGSIEEVNIQTDDGSEISFDADEFSGYVTTGTSKGEEATVTTINYIHMRDYIRNHNDEIKSLRRLYSLPQGITTDQMTGIGDKVYIGVDENGDHFIYSNADIIYFPAKMTDMFKQCACLKTLDLSGFNTSKVTDMSGMFWCCTSLTGLDLSTFDTSSVTNMSGMFYKCSSFTNLNLSMFVTSNVTDMSNMFRYCNSLETLNLSSFDTSKVTSMAMMFWQCQSLTGLDLSTFDTFNVTNMQRMFCECKSLTELDVSMFDTSSVTDMSIMFWGCTKLKTLNLGSLDTSSATNASGMFGGCKALASLDVSTFDTSKMETISSMFSSCMSLTELNLGNFDTSKVTSMASIFYECTSLKTLDLSKFNTPCLTNMDNMFNRCSKLTSLDVSGFDTSNVTSAKDLFFKAEKLSKIRLSKNAGNIFDLLNTNNLKCSKGYYWALDEDNDGVIPDTYDNTTDISALDDGEPHTYIKSKKIYNRYRFYLSKEDYDGQNVPYQTVYVKAGNANTVSATGEEVRRPGITGKVFVDYHNVDDDAEYPGWFEKNTYGDAYESLTYTSADHDMDFIAEWKPLEYVVSVPAVICLESDEEKPTAVFGSFGVKIESEQTAPETAIKAELKTDGKLKGKANTGNFGFRVDELYSDTYTVSMPLNTDNNSVEENIFIFGTVDTPRDKYNGEITVEFSICDSE